MNPIEVLRSNAGSNNGEYKPNYDVQKAVLWAYDNQRIPKYVDNLEYFMEKYYDFLDSMRSSRVSRRRGDMSIRNKIGTWEDEEYCLDKIKESFTNFNNCVFKNREFIEKAISIDGNVLSLIPDGVEDTDLLKIAIRTCPEMFRSVDAKNMSNKMFLSLYVINPDIIYHIVGNPELRFMFIHKVIDKVTTLSLILLVLNNCIYDNSLCSDEVDIRLQELRKQEYNAWKRATLVKDFEKEFKEYEARHNSDEK